MRTGTTRAQTLYRFGLASHRSADRKLIRQHVRGHGQIPSSPDRDSDSDSGGLTPKELNPMRTGQTLCRIGLPCPSHKRRS